MSPDSAVPGANKVLLTDTANEAGLVVGAVEAVTVAHDGAVTTDAFMALKVTLTVCAGGRPPAAMAVNASAAGVACTARSDGSTVYATGKSKVSMPVLL